MECALRIVSRCLKQRLEASNGEIRLFELEKGLTRLQAAKLFYHICGSSKGLRCSWYCDVVMNSKGVIHLSQTRCFEDIVIRTGQGL